MDKKEIEDLIGGMPFDDGEKAALNADAESGVPAQKILDKIELLLAAKQQALDTSDPEAAAAYAEIDREYRAAIKNASDEFDAKMKQMEQEADAIAKDVSKQLDNVRAEEIRASI